MKTVQLIPILSLFLFFLFLCATSSAQQRDSTAEQKLASRNIILPSLSAPVANYVNAVRVGKLIFLSGKGPSKSDGTYITGKVGRELSWQQGYEAARLTAINQLAVLKAELGSLNKISRIVKVLGLVNCTDDFKDHPKVINGFSDLIVEILGPKGKHARSAVGTNSLPFNMAVEVEMIVEVK
jgi:enamine deaminase RidA (YjgF/YER057c/UK114 family)